MAVGAGFGAVGVVIVLLIAILVQNTGEKEKDSRNDLAVQKPSGDGSGSTGATGSKPTVATPETTPPPAEPLPRRQQMVLDYDDFAKAHPDNYADRQDRLNTLMSEYDDDDWFQCIQARINNLKKYVEATAELRVKQAIAKSNTCVEQGDYQGAFEALDSFPESLSRTNAAFELNFHRKKVGQLVVDSIDTVTKKADAAMRAGEYDEALKCYNSLAATNYGPVMKDVRARQNEIKDIQKRGLRPGTAAPAFEGFRSFFAADAYAGVPEAVEAFDEAYDIAVHGGMPDADKLQKQLAGPWPRSAVLYFCLSMTQVRIGDPEAAAWSLKQARRLGDDSEAYQSRMHSAQARMHLAEFDLQPAEHEAGEALVSDPGNPDALFVMGLVNYIHFLEFRMDPRLRKEAAETLKKTAAYFQQAAKLDPGYKPMIPERLQGAEEQVENQEAAVDDPYAYKGTTGNAHLGSVVVILTTTDFGEALGTGWVVRMEGENKAYIVTNNHVIANGTDFKVKYRVPTVDSVAIKSTKEVKVLATDPENDLALLEVKTVHRLEPLSLKRTTEGLKLLETLTIIGHPKGLEFTVINAKLSNLSRVVEKKRHLQFDSNADHGMSGGPIIDENGFVIGVVVGGWDEIRGAGLGILSEHVRDLCAKIKIQVDLQ